MSESESESESEQSSFSFLWMEGTGRVYSYGSFLVVGSCVQYSMMRCTMTLHPELSIIRSQMSATGLKESSAPSFNLV